MNTFYRPGIVEMALHGLFGRHSWFQEHYNERDGGDVWLVQCRICYDVKLDGNHFPISLSD